jgi:putative aldouronate transport system permease protein
LINAILPKKGSKEMFKVRKTSDIIYEIIKYTIAAVIFIAVAYPIYFMIIASFSNSADVSNGNIWLLPQHISFAGYQRILDYPKLWIGYRNTILYTSAGTMISLLITIPAAFTMSHKKLMHKNWLMVLFTIPLFFSGGMIPTFLLVKNIGIMDTIWAMLLPTSFNIYNMIIARTFFQNTIPNELADAAYIDGCGKARYFIKIVLPLSKAIIAVMALYYAVGMWNNYFNALLYIRKAGLVPLQIVLRDILIANTFNERQGLGAVTSGLEQQRMRDLVKYCVIVVSTVPIICVYPFIQKYFTKGVMIGALKG